ncbi:ABC-2 type transport system ATP-binding protein [Bhargavaea ginsengi]|uniref:ABC-2 type transport system ATP-binding protein n=2 Tax=Bhargavaea ginsengi TaxID=426757 RepID=A0A1H7ATE6_9BACL|nr:ABC-2 type transport system ATP-binding protein [Bhargavaea ginsengi]
MKVNKMILSVENIGKSYGKQKVLHGVSFAIKKPCIVALVGPNGSGKSTLLNIIANLITPDVGAIEILGQTNRDYKVFQEFSYMQDNTVLYEYLTGYDHLQFIASVQKLRTDDIKAAAERIGTISYLDKKVSNYSLGMKQQLLLTMAILNKPKLLVMDEPLNGLDPTNAIKVRNLLLELVAEGTAILLSSHNLSEIDKVTSDVMFLKNGHLQQEDLKALEKVSYVLTVNHPENGEKILKEAGINILNRKGNRLTVTLSDSSINRIFRLLDDQGIAVRDWEKTVFGAEDRYRTLFGEPETAVK